MNHCAPRFRSADAHGFTLIEVLVVVVLIAITVVVVSVKIAPDDRDALNNEAARLAALLTQARDEAILTGTSLAWRAERDGYAFLQRDREGKWQPIAKEGPFRPRVLQPPVQLLGVEVAGRRGTAEEPLYFPSSGLGMPFRIVLGTAALRAAVFSPAGVEVSVSHE